MSLKTAFSKFVNLQVVSVKKSSKKDFYSVAKKHSKAGLGASDLASNVDKYLYGK